MTTHQPKPPVARTDVVYSCAISLDGYIASADGGVDWLHAAMVKGESYGLDTFMRSIDATVMGSRTFEQALQMGGGFTRTSQPCWVFSRRTLPVKTGVDVIALPPREAVAKLATLGVRRAWLMGGGVLAASFLEADLIDEIILGVMPVVLGAGIPIFGPLRRPVSLQLVESKTYKGGALGLRYTRASAPAR